MAFWKKKSDDPWDRDPSQPYSGMTTHYEQETGEFETKPANPTLLDEIREWKEERDEEKAKRKQEENTPLPPMNCPWCGKEMTEAYLSGQSGGAAIITEEKPNVFWGVMGQNMVYLTNDGGMFTNYKRCRQCKDCRKLVVDIPEPGLPGDPVAWWEDDGGKRSDGGTYWDGNMPSPTEEETEKE